MKKLIEVALPLDAINAEAAREKSIRHGHPSTLHLWWARRPLAACRAVLFASLVDDPGNYLPEAAAEVERKRLFGIIEQLVLWENINEERVLHQARVEIARSVARAANVALPAEDLTPAQVRDLLEKYAPPVLDPFAGGGSIPLEAQRLGLRAYASDLNPVAVLINKALIEIPPKFAGQPPVHPGGAQMTLGEGKKVKPKTPATTGAQWKGAAGLAADVRYYGAWMRAEAEKRIGHLYPKGPNGETVIAWLWARTVKCPNPACGATMPLVRSFALSTKKGKETWVEPQIDTQTKTVSFNVKSKGKPPEGTVNRQGARCLICNQPVPFEYLHSEGKARRLGAQLMAMVVEAKNSRTFLSPSIEHAYRAAQADPIWTPEEELSRHPQYMAPTRYGMTTHGDLYTRRQLATLNTFVALAQEAYRQVAIDARNAGLSDSVAQDYAIAVLTYLAFAIDKMTTTNCAICTWQTEPTRLVAAFSRQALSMTWDYAEANPFSGAAGDYQLAIGSLVEVLENLPSILPGQADKSDAAEVHPANRPLVSTDPPYYDNVPYADISDCFYVWLRHTLGQVYPELFTTLLTPKSTELVADYMRHGGRDEARRFFENGMLRVFGQLRSIAAKSFPLTVYYAFRQTEHDELTHDNGLGTASTGWETMLQGLIDSGFEVSGTWPIRSELTVALKKKQNALASSIVLVCRPRPESAPLATRREFVNTLKKELPAALTTLMHGGIAPVDLAQAAIGPGMAVFSRYAKVLEADGAPMPVRTALQLINQHLDEHLTALEGDFDRETRFALAWFEQHGHHEGAFGDADVLARAKDISVAGLAQAGVLLSKAGKVRLLRREELSPDWDPRQDARLTAWECAQQLIRRLHEKGEAGAATLARQMGGRSEDARALAYRLYALCERKKWADEALAYNALVVSWPEIEKQAASLAGEVEQGRLV